MCKHQWRETTERERIGDRVVTWRHRQCTRCKTRETSRDGAELMRAVCEDLDIWIGGV